LVLKRELFVFACFDGGVYEATESSNQATRGFLAPESFYQQDMGDAAAGRGGIQERKIKKK
jgi:hypothetical protein